MAVGLRLLHCQDDMHETIWVQHLMEVLQMSDAHAQARNAHANAW